MTSLRLTATLALLLPALACSSSPTGPDVVLPVDQILVPDTGGPDLPVAPDVPPPDTAPPADGGPDASDGPPPIDGTPPPDAPLDLATVPETEPNNAGSATEVNTFTVPSRVTGAIDPADDLDVFQVTLTAGTFLVWELSAVGAEFAPHFGLAQQENNVPTLASFTTAGGRALQEHFVLEGGTYNVIVRDSRNVPASSSQHVGSPAHTWQLVVRPEARTPMPVELPSQLTATLASVTSVDLYGFSASAGTGFDIILSAQRRNPASNMDSRISLYDVTGNAYLITNDDDETAGTLDSHVGGQLPTTGDYVLVVENVAAEATTLTYDLDFTLR